MAPLTDNLGMFSSQIKIYLVVIKGRINRFDAIVAGQAILVINIGVILNVFPVFLEMAVQA